MKKTLLPSLFRFLIICCLIGSVGCGRERSRKRFLKAGNQYFQEGDYARAEKQYLNILQQVGPDADALRQLGIIYMDQGRLPRAFAFLRESLAKDPKNIETRMKFAVVQASAGQILQARSNVLEVIRKNPRTVEALLLLQLIHDRHETKFLKNVSDILRETI